MELASHIVFIILTFLCFLGLAKISEKREHKGWIIAGIVVGILELLLVFGFLNVWLDKIV